MQVTTEPGMLPVKAWVDGVEFDEKAREQVMNLARMPFIYKHVAIMPDVHFGLGATVGSVIATEKAIIPAAVGVDIGCGMMAGQLSLKASDLPDSLAAIRSAIESVVPLGEPEGHGERIPRNVVQAYVDCLSDGLKMLDAPARAVARTVQQLGTLGTGNHFIELCLDETDAVWIMLHSGSRGIGNAIGNQYITEARSLMEEFFYPLPDKDLAFFPEAHPLFDRYMRALMWAQDYARINRELMFSAVVNAVDKTLGIPVMLEETAISCHHNYVARENHYTKNVWVTRKGAVRARTGDMGIIPGSMGTRSYIVRGKGNPESFMSCSHGAGRRMSRGEARRTFNLEDHAAATDGVECKKDASVLDETPGAYKDVDAVITAESDLIDVVHTLKQVLCVKG